MGHHDVKLERFTLIESCRRLDVCQGKRERGVIKNTLNTIKIRRIKGTGFLCSVDGFRCVFSLSCNVV